MEKGMRWRHSEPWTRNMVTGPWTRRPRNLAVPDRTSRNYGAVRGTWAGPGAIAGEFIGGPWREENSGATTGAGHVTRNPLPNGHELIVLRGYEPGQQCNSLN